MTNNQIRLLKFALLNYAIQVIRGTDKKNKKELWYKQALAIGKYFKSNKPEVVNDIDKRYLDIKLKQVIDLDAKYFEDKKYSSYVIMFELLTFLMWEVEDKELIKEFGNYPVEQVQKELKEMQPLKGIIIDSNKYLTELLKVINVDVDNL